MYLQRGYLHQKTLQTLEQHLHEMYTQLSIHLLINRGFDK